MQNITTTNLRTKSSQLVDALKKGMSVSLIHRSKVIGEIRPKKEPKPITKEDIKQLKKLAVELNLPKVTYQKREAIYRKHLLKKYGQNLS
jgi:antitoxin (DNA-binding transcriptional repressor) of toxin-antitoxin stability system